jgi:hypothetical protein
MSVIPVPQEAEVGGSPSETGPDVRKRPYLKNRYSLLPSKHETLSSIPSKAKEILKRKKKENIYSIHTPGY